MFGDLDGDFDLRDSLFDNWRIRGLSDSRLMKFLLNLNTISWKNIEFSEMLWDYIVYYALTVPERVVSNWASFNPALRNQFLWVLEHAYARDVADWMGFKEDTKKSVASEFYYRIAPFSEKPITDYAEAEKVEILNRIVKDNLRKMEELVRRLKEMGLTE
ncbi:MAG: hypothetical protein WBD36_03680 [Bacteroidota bacterium]